MARIVIKHLSGSKANLVEEFALDDFKEITFGRDASANVIFHPDKDDLVSRLHAKITRDPTDQNRFLLTDMESRNGTFLNRQMIRGSVTVMPGDSIQLGAGGPDFEFDLEPRPENLVRPTRVIEQPASPPTREIDRGIGHAGQVSESSPLSSQSGAKSGVGQATVERMIAKRFEGSRKDLINAGAALLGLIAIITGVLVYQQHASRARIESDLNARMIAYGTEQQDYQRLIDRQKDELAQIRQAIPISAKEIASKYGPATVFIKASWRLVDLSTGAQLYHQYRPDPDTGEPVACFLALSSETIEPLLTTESKTVKQITNPKAKKQKIPVSVDNKPVGSRYYLTGSGFVALSNGFILTNRHVGATWMTKGAELFSSAERAALCDAQADILPGAQSITPEQRFSLFHWVPGRSKQRGGHVEGRHDLLTVTFPRTNNPIPAELVRVSTAADVALLKIDVADAMPTVELADGSEPAAEGEEIYVLGYPAVSEDPHVQSTSADIFNPEIGDYPVPLPTISDGLIGKRVPGHVKTKTITESVYSSPLGDVYQLTVVATGEGNSGGPVLDSRGQVIGLFAFSTELGNTKVTYAVPIKYGHEIMGVKPIM